MYVLEYNVLFNLNFWNGEYDSVYWDVFFFVDDFL